MQWVTRERPKIDRIACPWLIRRFIDPEAEFLFVPPVEVRAVARTTGAIPYDVPDVELSHVGELCSFDAFLRKYALDDPALDDLARIVRGADTARLDLAPQSAGLLAISLGLSQLFEDDHEMLRHGMVVYDALYAWSKHAQGERHTWRINQKINRKAGHLLGIVLDVSDSMSGKRTSMPNWAVPSTLDGISVRGAFVPINFQSARGFSFTSPGGVAAANLANVL